MTDTTEPVRIKTRELLTRFKASTRKRLSSARIIQAIKN